MNKHESQYNPEMPDQLHEEAILEMLGMLQKLTAQIRYPGSFISSKNALDKRLTDLTRAIEARALQKTDD